MNFIVILMVLLSSQYAYSCDCDHLIVQEGESNIISNERREILFSCAGVTKYVSKFDTLDRDLLIMRLKNSEDVYTFSERKPENGSGKMYKNYIPMESIFKLSAIVRKYYGGKQVNGH